MKGKLIKMGFIASLLLGVLSLALSASAEENGYWTMETNESGMPVMIYTYTEPVHWVMDENSGDGHCLTEPTQPIAAVGQADVHLAANSPSAVQAAGKAADPGEKREASHPSTGLFILSGLSLFALMTALFIRIRKLKKIRRNSLAVRKES